MAEENTNGADAGEQQTHRQPEQQPGTHEPTQKPESGEGEDFKGAGSKDALRGELVQERRQRQQLEQKFTQMQEGIAKVFGIQPEQATPEQLTEQLTAAQAKAQAAETQLAVFLNAPDGVDTKALLDSRAFLDSLANVEATTPEALTAAIGAFVDANPRFRLTTQTGPTPGSRDSHAGQQVQGAKSMDDLIRGR